MFEQGGIVREVKGFQRGDGEKPSIKRNPGWIKQGKNRPPKPDKKR